jgi:hypothetical protein
MSDSEISNGKSRQDRKHRKALPKAASIVRQWKVDQLWSHSSDEGEEWLLIRLASPRNNHSSQNPMLRNSCQLLAAGEASVGFEC